MHEFLGFIGFVDFDSEYMNYTVQSWSGDWENRSKADLFMAEMEEWMQYYREENGEADSEDVWEDY